MNKNEELLPYYEKARDTLNYNSDTGIFTWRVINSNRVKIGWEAGARNSNGYRIIGMAINGKGRRLLAHRIAWFIINGSLPNMIDHINGIKDDNSISNLRSCTNQQNSLNKSKQSNNTSGFKGVCWRKDTRKWKAEICHNGKSISLGCFDCPKEASKVYEIKAKELFGEFYAEKS